MDYQKIKEQLGEEKFEDIHPYLNVTRQYVHNKTGNLYQLNDIILDATNATEGRLMVIYSRADIKYADNYCREIKEFFEKFTPKDKEYLDSIRNKKK